MPRQKSQTRPVLFPLSPLFPRGAIVSFALLALCVTLFASCATARADYFGTFRGAFEAEVHGTVGDLSFAAVISAQPCEAGAPRAATVTFYAPETLAGSVLTSDSAGNVTLTCGTLTANVTEQTFAALCDLFPTIGEVESVTLTEAGHTRVAGNGFAVEYRKDGSPARVETPAVTAEVIRFAK